VPGEKNLGLSWHNYCPDVFFESQGIPGGNTDNCKDYTANRETHAIDQANRMGAAALMTEWGATDNINAVRHSTLRGVFRAASGALGGASRRCHSQSKLLSRAATSNSANARMPAGASAAARLYGNR